jgi:hypothetical protein
MSGWTSPFSDIVVSTAKVRTWLSAAALAVPAALGVADEIQAVTADRVSLHLIETSYAADVSQVTCRPNQPAPDGAT